MRSITQLYKAFIGIRSYLSREGKGNKVNPIFHLTWRAPSKHPKFDKHKVEATKGYFERTFNNFHCEIDEEYNPNLIIHSEDFDEQTIFYKDVIPGFLSPITRKAAIISRRIQNVDIQLDEFTVFNPSISTGSFKRNYKLTGSTKFKGTYIKSGMYSKRRRFLTVPSFELPYRPFYIDHYTGRLFFESKPIWDLTRQFELRYSITFPGHQKELQRHGFLLFKMVNNDIDGAIVVPGEYANQILASKYYLGLNSWDNETLKNIDERYDRITLEKYEEWPNNIYYYPVIFWQFITEYKYAIIIMRQNAPNHYPLLFRNITLAELMMKKIKKIVDKRKYKIYLRRICEFKDNALFEETLKDFTNTSLYKHITDKNIDLPRKDNSDTYRNIRIS